MDETMISLGSIGLGLLGWGFGVAALLLGAKRRSIWPILPFASMVCCALAICLQHYYTSHRVNINDLSAIMDTAESIAGVSMFLLVTTLVINLAAFVVRFLRRGLKTP